MTTRADSTFLYEQAGLPGIFRGGASDLDEVKAIGVPRRDVRAADLKKPRR